MNLDLDAGKYAFYVWTSYGLTAAVVAWMLADTLGRAAKWRRKAERLQAEKDAKKVRS